MYSLQKSQKFSEELDISKVKTCLDTMGLKGLIVVISRGWGMNIKSKSQAKSTPSVCLSEIVLLRKQKK